MGEIQGMAPVAVTLLVPILGGKTSLELEGLEPTEPLAPGAKDGGTGGEGWLEVRVSLVNRGGYAVQPGGQARSTSAARKDEGHAVSPRGPTGPFGWGVWLAPG